MRQSMANSSAQQFPVLFIDMNTIKRYFAFDIVGGFAFFMLGRVAFHSDLICIALNIVAPQMLNFLLPTAQ
ncbi:hypothetical protein J40TS1_27080 [Paenibacillus montaniterrae]|uniref:Uncharacterized protein n=1 Tax=Paenibacillus montaniterrae TaxID=429341 RepID=A0A919YTK7_9BACL|nr:hypothetical protein [Paenibacillus montaniterrae]GIP17066.1 hypothetical protein J40TS1_27080 [Paenibacillus montaniterrae]